MAKPRLVFVMPEYSGSSSTHFTHVVDLVREAARFFDITLIIERGERPAGDLGCRNVARLVFTFLPLRYIELFFRILFLRLTDHRDYYVHYSFAAAHAASIVTGIFGGRVFYWNAGEPWKYPRGSIRERFERSAYHRISFLVTATEELKQEYARHYSVPEERIRVMPNWIDPKRFRDVEVLKVQSIRDDLKISSADKVVLYVHRLSRRKGAHLLPRIFEEFRSSAVKFIIAGDGPEAAALGAYVFSRDLGGMVHLVGPVPNSEIAAYYEMADLFIMPSEEEGFPRVLLEAMATGVPFAAFNVGGGGVASIVPHELREFVVSPGEVADFIAAMKKVLYAPDEQIARIKMLESEWVKRYDLKEVVMVFRSLFLADGRA